MCGKRDSDLRGRKTDRRLIGSNLALISTKFCALGDAKALFRQVQTKVVRFERPQFNVTQCQKRAFRSHWDRSALHLPLFLGGITVASRSPLLCIRGTWKPAGFQLPSTSSLWRDLNQINHYPCNSLAQDFSSSHVLRGRKYANRGGYYRKSSITEAGHALRYGELI